MSRLPAVVQLFGSNERVERRLAAILAADVAGYSRLMGVDEVGTLTALKAHRREIVDPAIAAHKGRIVKTTGDGMLVEFASAVDAVACAVAVQEKVAQRAADGAEPCIRFRVGVNVGDIIIDGDDIFGDGVNVAVRVENECEPGGVCLSDDAYRQVCRKTAFGFDDLGERNLKNIDRPMRVYAVRNSGAEGGKTASGANPARSACDVGKPLPLPDKPSIAVLPFQNMGSDLEQEYFADGVVEDIITILSRVKSLFVIARNSSFTYKGKAVDIRQVGRELGVRYVLEGSVRKAGERIRITGQLIDAASGSHVWADRFDRRLDDIFEVQDEISLKMVAAIQPELDRAEIQRARRKPDNLTAWDLMLRARTELYKMTKAENEKAKQFLLEAVQADPSSAMAQAMLSEAFAYEGFFGWESPRHSLERAIQHAAEGVRLDQGDPAPHCAMAIVLIFMGRAGEAVAYAKNAIELDPNTAAGCRLLAAALAFAGDPAGAIAAAEQVLRASPRDPQQWVTFASIANAHFTAGRYQLALEFADRAAQFAPNWVGSYLTSAASAAHLGLMEQARLAAARIVELGPKHRMTGIRNHPLFCKPDVVARFLDGLSKAGVPE
jgi:adenylate cyclase